MPVYEYTHNTCKQQRKLDATFRKMLSEPPANRSTEQGGGETGSGGDAQPAGPRQALQEWMRWTPHGAGSAFAIISAVGLSFRPSLSKGLPIPIPMIYEEHSRTESLSD